MKKILIIILIVVIAVFIGSKLIPNSKNINTPIQEEGNNVSKEIDTPIKEQPVACTMDAKECPDGSYVERVGPKCEFAMCPTPTTNSTTASINQSIFNNGVYIKPLEVLEDSRCPTGANCIWVGTVKIRAKLSTNDISQEIILTLNEPSSFENKKVTLIGVSPESNGKLKPSDYKFTFSVK